MEEQFTLSQFLLQFPTDESCLEEIKKIRFPKGVLCAKCKRITKHYKIRRRASYSCKVCRSHVYPLSGTLFEKSSTPLRLWFFTLFLMTQTRDGLSVKQLQRELGVTYKTAWRMRNSIRSLMEQKAHHEHKWVFFNKFEIKVVQRKEPTNDDDFEG